MIVGRAEKTIEASEGDQCNKERTTGALFTRIVLIDVLHNVPQGARLNNNNKVFQFLAIALYKQSIIGGSDEKPYRLDEVRHKC
jgi:hypothetical protein